FFSSRRRHTRSKRDWSSDVCSSDLRKFDSEPLGITRKHCLRVMPSGAGVSYFVPGSVSNLMLSANRCLAILSSRRGFAFAPAPITAHTDAPATSLKPGKKKNPLNVTVHLQ